MATSARTTIQTHLGAKAEALLGFHSPKISKARLPRSRVVWVGPEHPGSDEPAEALRAWPTGSDRISFDIARGSGDRARGGGELREKPRLLRRGKHRKAGDRRRLQRGGFHIRRPGRGGAQVCAQDSLHREAQSQRAAELSKQVRPDLFWDGERILRDGRCGRGSDDLLRLRAE